MSGILRQKAIANHEQFYVPNNQKLQMTLIGMADSLNDKVREHIDRVYNDQDLHSLYRGIRRSGIYQKAGGTGVRRKLIEFPSPHVYQFCDTVMKALYGPDWLTDRRALRHELVAPWLVVEKI